MEEAHDRQDAPVAEGPFALRRLLLWGGPLLLFSAAVWYSGEVPDTDAACSISAQMCVEAGEIAEASVPRTTKIVFYVLNGVGFLAWVSGWFVGAKEASQRRAARRAQKAQVAADREAKAQARAAEFTDPALARDEGRCRECGTTDGVEVFVAGDVMTPVGMSLDELKDPARMVALCAHHGPPRARVWRELARRNMWGPSSG